MNLEIFTSFKVLSSSTYSKMAIIKNCTLARHAEISAGFKANGYETVFSKAEQTLHTAVYKKDSEVVTTLRDSSTSELRIMWEDEKYNCLDPMIAPESTGNGETVMSQIGVGAYGHQDDDPMIGLLYIIKNSDGEAIVLDGGMPNEENVEDIYNMLASHGVAKDENGKYIIAAWIFTHAHGDHIGTFNALAKTRPEGITVKYFLYNFPGDSKVAWGGGRYEEFENNIDEKYPTAKRVVPRMGQIYYFGNVRVNIIFSPEMLYDENRPQTYFNDTGIAFVVKAEGVKTLFTGDIGDFAAAETVRCIRPATLKSDFVQITHHGLYTSTYLTPHSAEERDVMTKEERAEWEAERHINENLTRLYTEADPKIGLWPMGDTNGQPRNGRTTVMRDWSRQYGQTAYFVDTSREDSGYDGVNIVRKGDLITYTMSSETELMITKFLFKDGEAVLQNNQTWESFLEK